MLKFLWIYNAISFGICGAPVPLALKCRLRKIITISNSRKEQKIGIRSFFN